MVKPFEKITLNSGVTLANRIVMAPITNSQSLHDGQVSLDEINFYQKRAKGLGAIIVSAANVTDSGKGWFGELSLADDKFIPNLKKLVTAIHQEGAKAFIQIFHVGRLGHERIIGAQPIAPSEIIARRPGSELPKAMTENEIDEVIVGFGEATRRAILAGFDGVEIHGANGYLIQEFFSSHANNRTDSWGETIEKRFNFPKAVIKSVFAAKNKYSTKPFAIGYRFSPEEFGGGGIQLTDTFWLLDQLVQFPFDYLHISSDDYRRVAKDKEFQNQSLLTYLHNHLKNQVPLIGVGGVRTRQDVSNILANAELVAIAHQLIMQPNWPILLKEQRDSEFNLLPLTEAVEHADITPTFYDYLINRFVRIGMLPQSKKR